MWLYVGVKMIKVEEFYYLTAICFGLGMAVGGLLRNQWSYVVIGISTVYINAFHLRGVEQLEPKRRPSARRIKPHGITILKNGGNIGQDRLLRQ